MSMSERVRGAMRRLGGRVSVDGQQARKEDKRRTQALPSILNSYGARADAMPKATPQNLRRFAETPVARKAINTIKDRIAGMNWRVQPRRSRALEELPQGAERIRILTEMFEQPNPDDSFRSMAEQVLEDIIVGGFGAIELQLTGDAARPLALWPVDGTTIQMRSDWDGRPASPRYVQTTGKMRLESELVLNDEELSYIRLNPRTHTPFGLGRLEVAFETIASFLTANRYASRLASNSVVQYALWLKELDPAQHERLRRYFCLW